MSIVLGVTAAVACVVAYAFGYAHGVGDAFDETVRRVQKREF